MAFGAPTALTAQSIATDRNTYVVGAPITLRYETAAAENEPLPAIAIVQLAGNAQIARHAAPRGPSELRIDAPGELGDFEVRLLGRDDAVLARARFGTEVTPVAGALRLPKTKFAAGEKISLGVSLPDGRYYQQPWVGLFRAGANTAGGAVLADHRHEWQQTDRKSPLEFTAPSTPGRYALRVFDRNQWYYILDAVEFDVEVPTAPGALALTKQRFVVGEKMAVSVTLPPNRFYSNPWVGLFEADDTAARGGAGQDRQRLEWKNVGEGGAIEFTAPSDPGRYEFRVFDRNEWKYRLDTITFEVEVPPVPGALALTKERYAAGEKMAVTVTLPPNRFYGNPWVGLFEADDTVARGGAGQDRQRLEWKNVGEGGAIEFTAPSDPGRYEFRVFDRNEWKYRLDTIAFEVEVPPVPGALALPKRRFVAGEKLAVTVTLPPNRSFPHPWVGLFEGDDVLALGGAGLDRHRLEWKNAGEGGAIEFIAPSQPGLYEFRVFDRHGWKYRLDAIQFEVVVTPAPAAALLRPEKATYAPGEQIRVLVGLPADRIAPHPWVGCFTSGHTVRGGAAVGESLVHGWNINPQDPHLAFAAPELEGPYELRFYDRGDQEYVLAIAPIVVRGDVPTPDQDAPARLTPMPGAGTPPRPLPASRPTDPRETEGLPNERPAGVPKLRFVAVHDDGFALLGSTRGKTSCVIEATFDEPPPADTYTGDIADEDGQSFRILFFRSPEDPKIFRSGVIPIRVANGGRRP